MCVIAAAASAVALASCERASPPSPLLAGEWGRSETACRAGVVATFDEDAVHLRIDDEPDVLLARPHYSVDERGRIVIRFALPRSPGGVDPRGGVGVVVLEGAEEGRLRVVARRYQDLRTGAVAAQIDPRMDALGATLSLVRCSGAAEGAKLRGRS